MLFAQEKVFEMESRLKQNDVPSNALNFYRFFSLKNKVKNGILEGRIGRKSIEAKFKRAAKKKNTRRVEF